MITTSFALFAFLRTSRPSQDFTFAESTAAQATFGQSIVSAWESIEALPMPSEIQYDGQESHGNERLVLRELSRLSLKLKNEDLVDLHRYSFEQAIHQSSHQRESTLQLLALLTRISYRVEEIEGPRRLYSRLFAPGDPSDWLWPIRLSEKSASGFKLCGTGDRRVGLVDYTISPYTELMFVSQRVPRRIIVR